MVLHEKSKPAISLALSIFPELPGKILYFHPALQKISFFSVIVLPFVLGETRAPAWIFLKNTSARAFLQKTKEKYKSNLQGRKTAD